MGTTPNFGWTFPTVGASQNVWGDILNNLFLKMDANLFRIAPGAAGAIDNMVIGASAPKAGTFSTLTSLGTFNTANSNISGTLTAGTVNVSGTVSAGNLYCPGGTTTTAALNCSGTASIGNLGVGGTINAGAVSTGSLYSSGSITGYGATIYGLLNTNSISADNVSIGGGLNVSGSINSGPITTNGITDNGDATFYGQLNAYGILNSNVLWANSATIGSISASGGVSFGNYLDLTGPLYVGAAGVRNGEVYFRRAYDGTPMGRIFCYDSSGGLGLEAAYGYPIHFYTGNAASGGNPERMKIDQDGRVTIWSYDSYSNFVVSGNTAGLRIGQQGNTSYIDGVDWSGTASWQPLAVRGWDLSFAPVSGEAMHINNYGQIGINNPNDYYVLKITGTDSKIRIGNSGSWGRIESTDVGETVHRPLELGGSQVTLSPYGNELFTAYGGPGPVVCFNPNDQQKAFEVRGNYRSVWLGGNNSWSNVFGVDPTGNIWVPLAVGGSRLSFNISGSDRARINESGYLKVYNVPGYGDDAFPGHEFIGDAGSGYPAAKVVNFSGDPTGFQVAYNSYVSDYTHYFANYFVPNQIRWAALSNGGTANFKYYDMDLSDAALKQDVASYTDTELNQLETAFKLVDWGKFKFAGQSDDDFHYGYTAQGVEGAFSGVVPGIVKEMNMNPDQTATPNMKKTVRSHNLHNIGMALLARALDRISELETKLAAMVPA